MTMAGPATPQNATKGKGNYSTTVSAVKRYCDRNAMLLRRHD